MPRHQPCWLGRMGGAVLQYPKSCMILCPVSGRLWKLLSLNVMVCVGSLTKMATDSTCAKTNADAGLPGLPLSTSEKLFRFHETGLLLALLAKLALGGFLAFGLGFSEFLLVSKTSSLALSISGIFKEVCTLLLATHLMGDHLSLLNWLGFVVCLLGITLHVALRAKGQKGPKPPKEPDLELLLLPHQDGEEALAEVPLQR